MIIPELLAASFISLVMTGLFYLATKTKQLRKTGLIWILVILILSTWAGGVWIKPIGPALGGIHWLSFLLVGSIITLLLIITMPRKPPRGRHETIDMLEAIEREREIEQATYFTLSIFFWALLILLVLPILYHYVFGI